MQGPLPNETNAEAAVISSMMLDPSTIDRSIMHGFRAEHCYADANRFIIEAIFWLHNNGGVIDLVTVVTRLRDTKRLGDAGGAPYVASLVDGTPAIANVLEHASIIMEKWRLRQAIGICQTAVATGYGPIENAQEYLEKIELGIAEIAHEHTRIKIESIGGITARVVNDLTEAQKNPDDKFALETGLTLLDRMLGGGLIRGNVYVVGARPGMGKTAFATTIARNVSVPKKRAEGLVNSDVATFFSSLEMPRNQLGARFITQESGVPIGDILAQRVKGDPFTKVVNAAASMTHWPIFVDDAPAVSVAEIRASVRTLKRRIASGLIPARRLGLVAIDYLQLMKGIRAKGSSREEEVASLSRGLKELAKEEDVPVLALSQLNRRVEKNGKDREPELIDLRESGSIEQDADAVLFLYREGYYDKDANQTTAKIIIAKQRNGPTGYVEAVYKATEMRFYNITSQYEEYFDEFDDYVT